MSDIRKIKILYSISFALLLNIVWSFVTRFLFNESYDYKVFIGMLVSACILQILYHKISNMYFLIGVSALFSIPFYLHTIYNFLIVIFLLYLLYKSEKEDPSYSDVGYYLKRSMVILFVTGFLDSGRNTRLYVIFLIITIILIRETRNYTYKIKNKRSSLVNIILAGFIGLMSIPWIYVNVLNLTLKLIQIIWYPISYAIVAVAYFLLIILAALKRLYLLYIQSKGKLKSNGNSDVDTSNVPKVPQNYIAHPPAALVITIEAVIIIGVLYVLFKLFRRKHRLIDDNSEYVEVHVEKVIREKGRKKRKRAYGNDIRSKVLYLFYKFESLADKKGFYKPYMTAGELKNSTLGLFKKEETIANLTNIYNETKFSKHEASEVALAEMKKNYEIIKKEI